MHIKKIEIEIEPDFTLLRFKLSDGQEVKIVASEQGSVTGVCDDPQVKRVVERVAAGLTTAIIEGVTGEDS
jgi:hypothetical protein